MSNSLFNDGIRICLAKKLFQSRSLGFARDDGCQPAASRRRHSGLIGFETLAFLLSRRNTAQKFSTTAAVWIASSMR
jgi:hypothetical protein